MSAEPIRYLSRADVEAVGLSALGGGGHPRGRLPCQARGRCGDAAEGRRPSARGRLHPRDAGLPGGHGRRRAQMGGGLPEQPAARHPLHPRPVRALGRRDRPPARRDGRNLDHRGAHRRGQHPGDTRARRPARRIHRHRRLRAAGPRRTWSSPSRCSPTASGCPLRSPSRPRRGAGRGAPGARGTGGIDGRGGRAWRGRDRSPPPRSCASPSGRCGERT